MERVAIYDRSCTGDVSTTVERLKSFAEQNRPAYRKMLSDAGLGKYDILLIRGVSRISRNITTFLKAKKSLEGKGIRIYDCEYGGFLDAVISEVGL